MMRGFSEGQPAQQVMLKLKLRYIEQAHSFGEDQPVQWIAP